MSCFTIEEMAVVLAPMKAFAFLYTPLRASAPHSCSSISKLAGICWSCSVGHAEAAQGAQATQAHPLWGIRRQVLQPAVRSPPPVLVRCDRNVCASQRVPRQPFPFAISILWLWSLTAGHASPAEGSCRCRCTKHVGDSGRQSCHCREETLRLWLAHARWQSGKQHLTN